MINKPGWEKLILKSIRVGIFLVLLTPLVFGRFNLSFSEFPKVLYFRTLTEVLAVFYAALLLVEGKKFLPQIKGRILLPAALIFIGILGLATLFSVNPSWSLWGTVNRSLGWVTYLHFFAFFWILVSTVKNREDWLLLIKATVLVSGISSLAGVLQKLDVATFLGINLPQRISGTFSNADFFGSYLVINIFLGLFLLALKDKSKTVRISLAAITVLNFVTLFLSGHRAGWVATAAGFAAIGFFWAWNRSKNLKRVLIYALISLGILGSLFFLGRGAVFSTENYLLQRAVSIFNLESALESRLFIWKTIYKGWEERPFLGWGPETSGYLFDKYRTAVVDGETAPVNTNTIIDRPHNKILEIAADSGLVGVAGYLFLFSAIFYLIFRYRNRWGSFPSLVLASLFVAYFVQNLALFDTIGSYLIFFLLLGFVDVNLSAGEENEAGKKQAGLGAGLVLKGIAFILILLSAISFYVFNLRSLKINLDSIRARNLESKDFSAALDGYQQVSQVNGVLASEFWWDTDERMLVLYENNKIKGFEQKTANILVGAIPRLEQDLQHPIKSYLRRYLLLARTYEVLYLMTKNLKFADLMEDAALRMRNFNDAYPETYWYLGKAQIYHGNYAEGEATFNQALEFGFDYQVQDQVRHYVNLAGSYLNVVNKEKTGESLQKVVDLIYNFVKDRPERNFSAKTLEWLNGEAFRMEEAAQFYIKFLKDDKTALEIYKKAIFIYPAYEETFQQKIDALKGK
jgi:O-antigen ligase